MTYRYELHCHTKEVSRCGKIPAAQIVELYRQKGYHGIVITDHFSPMTFSPISVFQPQNFIDFYVSGWRAAKLAAPEDFSVLLGMELRYYATANDYLVYGADEHFLRSHGNLMTYYPRRFYKLAKKNDLIVVQAHPFREGMIRTNPKYLDGCEVFNGKNIGTDANEKAEAWADKHHMNIRTGGSDFHRLRDLATGGIETDRQIKTNAQLLDVLRRNDFDLICGTREE